MSHGATDAIRNEEDIRRKETTPHTTGVEQLKKMSQQWS